MMQVARLHRLYISGLVKKGLFSRQLAALREIDAMLLRGESLPGADAQQLQQGLREVGLACCSWLPSCMMHRIVVGSSACTEGSSIPGIAMMCHVHLMGGVAA